MTKLITLISALLLTISLGTASAGVYTSNDVLNQAQYQFSKQQVLTMVDSQDVLAQLEQLGVNPIDAKNRINNMTQSELNSLNEQMNNMPAGGIVGAIVTVLAVVALLDLFGVTDVYPFIRPINS
ncbi:PA2779 family protein [uncultured Paraglaciecola sp.]|uniref:PA2779 family protein n=1 Tax=uncultured Paraglaciecola sp. TaxID=1765024 RepID=UPI0030D896E1|tara:strand:+ start:1210 stop:1584 length:375 start_codon:yes stop_codon:yes gene_type:complete